MPPQNVAHGPALLLQVTHQSQLRWKQVVLFYEVRLGCIDNPCWKTITLVALPSMQYFQIPASVQAPMSVAEGQPSSYCCIWQNVQKAAPASFLKVTPGGAVTENLNGDEANGFGFAAQQLSPCPFFVNMRRRSSSYPSMTFLPPAYVQYTWALLQPHLCGTCSLFYMNSLHGALVTSHRSLWASRTPWSRGRRPTASRGPGSPGPLAEHMCRPAPPLLGSYKGPHTSQAQRHEYTLGW